MVRRRGHHRGSSIDQACRALRLWLIERADSRYWIVQRLLALLVVIEHFSENSREPN